jgi:protoheme IX farnesyltransferase
MWALFIALALLAAGFNVLANVDTHTTEVLSLTALSVFWYNVVYTYLKRWSAFAVVPGALVGAIPPIIGWTAAGGVVTDRSIMPLAFFLFLWQIPHFWLLLLMFGKDYEQAGLPSVTKMFSSIQLRRITFMWILCTAAAGLMLAMAGHVPFPWNLAFLVASVWLVTAAAEMLRPDENTRWKLRAFLKINLYVLIVMALMVAQALAP